MEKPEIITADELSDVFPDLDGVIKDAFGKSLPEGYEKQPIEQAYFTADHLAFGIVTKLKDGTPHLDKLAVSPQVQGRGIGQDLWHRITADYPAIVWRSHIDNHYATWYYRHADIMKRQGEWILFACGVDFPKLESVQDELTDIPQMR